MCEPCNPFTKDAEHEEYGHGLNDRHVDPAEPDLIRHPGAADEGADRAVGRDHRHREHERTERLPADEVAGEESARKPLPAHIEPEGVAFAQLDSLKVTYGGLSAVGILLVDSELVPSVPQAAHVVSVPITTLAIEKIGKSLFANIVALGAITRVSDIVPLDAVKNAVANRVPPHTVEANMQALMVGYEAAAN